MRPTEIVWFERIQLFLITYDAICYVFLWREWAKFAILIDVSMVIVVVIICVTLTLLITRRRSRVAMWALVSLLVFGWISDIQYLFKNGTLFTNAEPWWVYVPDRGANLVSLWLLFTPSARNWLRRRADTTITAG